MSSKNVFSLCPNCGWHKLLSPAPQKRKNMPPLSLCEGCLEDLKKGLPAKTSETRYREMAENLAKKEIK